MRATTIHAPGDIRLSDVPDPKIGSPTEAIVKVVAGCICGSDLWPYRGENPIDAGSTIGHECVGVVEEVGGEVRDFRAGDFVVVPFCHCDNTCDHCRAGVQSACSNQGFTESGQAEYTVVHQADGSLVKTDGMPDDDLIPSLLALSDVMATGWHAAVAAGVREGGTAVVVGDGAVGLCGVLAASVMGAEKVIAMSRHEPRQQIATKFGATHIVAERGKEGGAAVKEITGGLGGDAVLECVGTDQAIQTAFGVARPGSTVGFVGRTARCGAADPADVRQEHRAGRRHGSRAPLPAGADGAGAGREDQPRHRLRHDPAARRSGRGLPRDGRAALGQGADPALTRLLRRRCCPA